MSMYFDSHCHLDFEPLKEEAGQVIERAYRAGVAGMINVGSSMRGSRFSVEIANAYPNIWASVGLHPHDAETIMDLDVVIEELEALAENDKVVAIGEIGLDYFYLDSKELIPKQKELFVAQLELAKKLGKPIIIHTRDADEDMLEILGKYKELSGVVHCFTGSPEFVQKLLALGYCIGFTGFVTFDQDKFNHIRESVKVVPMERLLIETDAPFLAPEPYRGKTNEPAFVVEVAGKIAQIKGITVEEVAKKTLKNTYDLFKIK